MAVLKGYAGNIKESGTTIGEMSEWSLDVSADIVDTSAFGDEWKKKTATQKDWSGSCSGRLDTSNAGQSALTIGADVDMEFYVDSTHYYSGAGVVESISRSAVVNGVLEVTFNFTGNGELSYT